jgi:hypothetical protein
MLSGFLNATSVSGESDIVMLRDRAGDVPDIGKAAHGFNRIDLDGNGTDYPTGSSYRIAIKPESYDGVEDWEEYISLFDICAELGKWRDQDKVLALAAACSIVFYSVVKSIIISLSSSIFNVVWISKCYFCIG